MSQRQNQILTVLIIIAVVISGANTYLLFNHIDLQREQYATLENISELRDDLDDVASSLDGLQDEITSLQGNFSEVEEEIADRLGGLEEGIQESLDELSSLETTLEDVTGEIQGFNSSMRDELESLSAEVAAIDERVGGSLERTPSSVYEARRASVVKITTTAGQGSGFMWRSRNYIVTNHHVVDGAEEANIGYYDGSWTVATVVGSDPYSDVAVLRVEEAPLDSEPLTLADSSLIYIGQEAVAIGNPLGSYGALSSGIISQVNEKLDIPPIIVPVLQLDVTIAPGSSGGPLFDLDGNVLGITNAGTIYGINFAVSSNIVDRVANSIVEEGIYQHPLVGFFGYVLNPDIVTLLNLQNVDTHQHGIIVMEVMEGYPAEEAGLEAAIETTDSLGDPAYTAKDIIIAIDGIEIRTWGDWDAYIAEHVAPDQEIVLTVWRSGAIEQVTLETAARPEYTG
ncbi:trypsin-like peptidase domain-containing protein [Candidatus Bathyarchaeota archaeon]|nr:trypsin-like peptidase domain-containing protein [Candidatus Bathyarchaeota archaeon]